MSTQPVTSERPFDVVLFDLDGTLWDSQRGIIDCLERTFTDLGHPVPDRGLLARHLGPPLEVMLAETGIPEEQVAEAVTAYRIHYRDHGESACDLYGGTVELLDGLRAVGIRLATATSKGMDPTLRMLHAFDIAHYFEQVGAASMDSSRHAKPDVIEYSLALMGNPNPATVAMVGDRHYDIGGAQQFGLTSFGVSWGYSAQGELAESGADLVVESFTELASALHGSAPHGSAPNGDSAEGRP